MAPSALRVIVAPTQTVSDIDDTRMTKAASTIATTCTGSYGDATCDVLSLPAGYMAPGTPLIEASWDTSSCTLTLAPAGSVSAVAMQDMLAAMRAVVYLNLNSALTHLNIRGVALVLRVHHPWAHHAHAQQQAPAALTYRVQ